ncbi:MAG: 5-formyltetrahydrofolate cyclo-ligase [Burkholderiales bacterium]|jgi:5-formyltetrahydrofolate cyclo-ligase|nr:5-formyltetrahydrofolate cyclo-ligase [Burkholderiales bacterium]
MKQIIRKQIKALLKTYTDQTRHNAAKSLLDNLQPLLEMANTVALYHALDYELNLSSVINYCIINGLQLYQPLSYRDSRHMLLVRYDAHNQEIFSSQEFIPDKYYEWYNLDLVLLPLIAVDKFGFRLGKGGGYYDTTLANLRDESAAPVLCGVGFDSQLIQSIPHDNWDIRLDYFASEQRLIKF